MSPKVELKELNAIDNEKFRRMFENVIELCSDAARKAVEKRPFNTVQELCDSFYNYLDLLTEDEKVVVLNLHPDLAGRLAVNNELTRESAGEQSSAGLQNLSADQKYTIDSLNEKYKLKFGFPFIICARENKVTTIIEGLNRRYNNKRETEILTAINEVKKICRLRILDIVRE